MNTCLLGLFCGDAAGATLEFYRGGKITKSIAQKAMRMPGGGVLHVGPGQVTDDSELAMSLHMALQSTEFPLDLIAQKYGEWYDSGPFDIGMTCAKAFGNSAARTGATMIELAAKYNMESEANGALMRVAPIAIWAVSNNKTYDKIAEYARIDAQLSHPNEICQECNAVYCVALAALLKNVGIGSAFEIAEKYIKTEKVKEWFNTDISNLDCTKNIGHLKYAFALAFYFLRVNSSYEDAITETLMKGGDTDTNAAIVGAMMGAAGRTPPDYMVEKVMAFDCVNPKKGHQRPECYSVRVH
jgi:ADP-ribosyl-[dinitrogen reductase] hydrolase